MVSNGCSMDLHGLVYYCVYCTGIPHLPNLHIHFDSGSYLDDLSRILGEHHIPSQLQFLG